MDEIIKKAVKEFIAQKRRIQMPVRSRGYMPSDLEFYQFVSGELMGDSLSKMIDYLRVHPEDEALITQARQLMDRPGESFSASVPRDAVRRAQSLMSNDTRLSARCPHCGKAVTPFKTPLLQQKILAFLWLVSGTLFMGLSFFIPRFFIQWVVLGAVCFLKWAIDAKTTKTQILIYKALTSETAQETGHLHRAATHL